MSSLDLPNYAPYILTASFWHDMWWKPFHFVQLHSITEYGHFSLSKITPHHTFRGNLPHWFPHADSQGRLSSQFPGDWSDCSQNSDSRSVSEKIYEHVCWIEWLSTIHTISRPTQINKGLYHFPIAFSWAQPTCLMVLWVVRWWWGGGEVICFINYKFYQWLIPLIQRRVRVACHLPLVRWCREEHCWEEVYR